MNWLLGIIALNLCNIGAGLTLNAPTRRIWRWFYWPCYGLACCSSMILKLLR